MWRNPQPTWTSPNGRVVQLGDAAHTFIPSSGSGATQALEDGIYLASCLQISGKERAGLASKIYNKLRLVFPLSSLPSPLSVSQLENPIRPD